MSDANVEVSFTASVGDLIQAFPSVAKAAGLRAKAPDATPEASPAPGK